MGEVVRKAIIKVYAGENFVERKNKAFEIIKKFRVKQKGMVDYKTFINDGSKHNQKNIFVVDTSFVLAYLLPDESGRV